MDLTRQEKDGATVLGFPHPVALDASNAAALRETLTHETAHNPRLVLEMGRVGFVDSSAIGALVGVMRDARAAGGDLKLANPGRDVRTILELTRLNRVFGIHASADEAAGSF